MICKIEIKEVFAENGGQKNYGSYATDNRTPAQNAGQQGNFCTGTDAGLSGSYCEVR